MNGDEQAIKLFQDISDIAVPVIVVGELYYGAYKSARVQSNISLFSDLLSNFEVIDLDESIARAYGEIKAELVKKGINIPENDIWIAAIAKAHDRKLITFDAHFAQIDGMV